MASILIVDDDPLVSGALSRVMDKMGQTSSVAASLAAALEAVRHEAFDIIFCDVRLPDGSGLDILPELRTGPLPPEVIIITGFGDPDGAELAIKKGAWDYVEKPLAVKDVMLAVERALQYRDRKRAVPAPVALKAEDIIGKGPKLRACLDALAQAASSEANVLISGETGTGKELFAWAIHRNSARAERNFVVVDCAALPETLVESTLFGHVRGAFTGADKPRDGLVRQADGGTLFLDEIGELPLAIQKAFLRVLQERRFRPVGGGQEVSSDFRLVAATNRNLEDMVRAGDFREDLLFRIRTFVLALPPLRETKEDLKDLVVHYVVKFCDQYGVPMKSFSPDFEQVLTAYDWPGNVRELIQALEKAIVTAKDEPVLFPKHLPEHIRVRLAREAVLKKKATEPARTDGPAATAATSLKDWRDAGLARLEGEYLAGLMRTTAGDIPEACRISGLSRSRLYTLLKKYGVPLS
ncbi:MAG TPA: sigma-54 dependent transcriptional regulator [Candidatus Aminicenantes bacterium]|nr:sigma-54 dependent transcriptional regulator [Candidatus Aminicenantes bacterium]HRY65859.1 sigma-54 dependent transcriptional regulator [Candidatus Aminicenantes bacterium]HRZ72815.1 sigma-54 dependent transcriptional regulator [Candidatus Aminicenantes bacterium]